MIRLVLTRLLDLQGEKWRVPLGRGSITAFEVDDGGLRVGERLAPGSPDEPTARTAAAPVGVRE